MQHVQQNRRQFLKTVTAGAAALTAGTLVYCTRKQKQPNILLCIADDQSYPHTSAYGSRMVRTPAFDRISQEGILFNHAFVSAPSCCPSRGSLLTGQAFYRLKEGAQNWSKLDAEYPTFSKILEDNGYHVGYTGKGWGPGVWQDGGWKQNPAGKAYNSITISPPTEKMSTVDYTSNFKQFLSERGKKQPFCFWFGPYEPHRDYQWESAIQSGKKLVDAEVPPFLPDHEIVRKDLLDYALEIEYFDTHVLKMIEWLADTGELDNTLIVVTSDNGMPFPRAKATLFDAGVHVPLAIRWGDRIKGNRKIDDFVSLTDLAPTFLEAAGIMPPAVMTGHSLLNALQSQDSGRIDLSRKFAVFGRERHHHKAFSEGGLSFPCRAISTMDFLYIRNYKPGRSIAGEGPDSSNKTADLYWPYPDVDYGPTKTFMLNANNMKNEAYLFDLAFGPRPARELYDLHQDPHQLHNVAENNGYREIVNILDQKLNQYLVETEDPRALSEGDIFDSYPVRGI